MEVEEENIRMKSSEEAMRESDLVANEYSSVIIPPTPPLMTLPCSMPSP
ncbi:uncharacterized protein G2W53_016124 [Senna tora]|uniref:Uncharacterized protein n=1 Tax=Senna tora TaxID=362788 RepID=A0A835C920_9FABA|nr:uncharacterized protein G2W53_016124 [Senna tora]